MAEEGTSHLKGKAGKEQYSKCSNGAKQKSHPECHYTSRSEYYNMNHKCRGKALIFSHDQFDIDLPRRPGTTKDCEKLNQILTELGFCIDVLPNLRYIDIKKHIEQTAKMNHSKSDCLLIMVLSHGGPSGMLYAKDTHYKAEELWCRFTEENCPTLAGKPKLFFLQACQGQLYDKGVSLSNRIVTDGWFEHKYPTYPDFLLVLSTVPGYYSWRNIADGSWFIQALCEELCYNASDMDILTLLTYVSQKVALNFESNTPKDIKSHQMKQVPCVRSMLTRRLVFTKKPDNSLGNMNSLFRYFKC